MRIIFIVIILITTSCSKQGEIYQPNNSTIEINGELYKFIKVVPADGAKGVWLLVPYKATIKLPQLTSYSTGCGKNCTYQLQCIWVKS